MTDARRLLPFLGCSVALLLSALCTRLPLSLDGQDSVNFARALLEFDPRAEQPHFPGYPVYVALCRTLHAAGVRDALALALPGVLAVAALLPAVAAVGRQLGLPLATLALSLPLLAVHPLLLAEGPRPLPDLLGTAALWSALALALTRRPLAAGLLFAGLLGIRPDLAPCALAIVAAPAEERPRLVQGFAAGLLLWLPLALAAYPPGWLPALADFGVGHFSVWGSTATAGAGSMGQVLWNLHALGPGVAGLGLALLGLLRAPERARRGLALVLGPYLAWLLIGQNLANARHFLPLLPAVALLAGHGLASLATPARRRVSALVFVLLGLPAFAPLLEPPLDGHAAVVRAVHECGACAAVYTGGDGRLFDQYAPTGFPAYRRASIDAIRRDLNAWDIAPGYVLVTSGVTGAARYGPAIVHLGRGLELYRIETAALR